VASVQIAGEKPPRAEPGILAGEVPGLEAAAAVDLGSLKGAVAGDAGKAGEGKGSFRIEGLLPGRHAVFLRTGSILRAGLPARLALTATERTAAEKRIASVEEFFDRKRPLLLGGDRRRLWALLELTRSDGTTLTDEKGASFRFRRWEAWVLRADGKGESGEPWRIESRIFIDRAVVPSGGKLPEIAAELDPRLAEVEVRPGVNALP